MSTRSSSSNNSIDGDGSGDSGERVELHSPVMSDISSHDTDDAELLALSEISSIESYELIEQQQHSGSDEDDNDPATQPQQQLTRRDILRDRHEAVLLTLRPELPPTVFQFPDPIAQSDDEDDFQPSEGLPHHDEHNALIDQAPAHVEEMGHEEVAPPIAQQQLSYDQAHMDQEEEEIDDGATSTSTADCRSDSTRTTTFGMRPQPRWLARTSAWLANVSSGSALPGTAEVEYTLPKLMLGNSFAQSCCDALIVPPAQPLSSVDGSKEAGANERQGNTWLQLRPRSFAKWDRRGTRIERLQAASFFTMLAFAAALLSVGLRLLSSPPTPSVPAPAMAAAPPATQRHAACGPSVCFPPRGSDNRAVGPLAPVSLQIWQAVETSAGSYAPTFGLGARTGNASDHEEPHARVRRVLEARKRRRTAAAAAAAAAASASQAPMPTPTATMTPQHSLNTTPPPQFSTVDWHAVILFLRSVFLDAQRLFSLGTKLVSDLVLEFYKMLVPYGRVLWMVGSEVGKGIQGGWNAVHSSTKPYTDPARTYVRSVVDTVAEEAKPYIQDAHEKVKQTAGQAREFAENVKDGAQDHYARASARAEPYVQYAREAAEETMAGVKENAQKRAHDVYQSAAEGAGQARKAADDFLGHARKYVEDATAKVQAQAQAHRAARRRSPPPEYESEEERLWYERNRAKADRYRQRRQQQQGRQRRRSKHGAKKHQHRRS
ncbi:hypothetical protein V8E36_009003 [Tilletia maclaganii]